MICDLSSKNPNVLYELGIRQAFNLPVTLIKDQKTSRIFDIQGFRDVEYDETLRIDNVEETIELLAETMKNTYEKTNEVNSLISLLGVEPAKINHKNVVSFDTQLILNLMKSIDGRIIEIENKISINYITNKNTQLSSLTVGPKESVSLGDFLTSEDVKLIKIGDKLFHARYGVGAVRELSSYTNSANFSVLIQFESGLKRIVVSLAKLRKVN